MNSYMYMYIVCKCTQMYVIDMNVQFMYTPIFTTTDLSTAALSTTMNSFLAVYHGQGLVRRAAPAPNHPLHLFQLCIHYNVCPCIYIHVHGVYILVHVHVCHTLFSRLG